LKNGGEIFSWGAALFQKAADFLSCPTIEKTVQAKLLEIEERKTTLHCNRLKHNGID